MGTSELIGPEFTMPDPLELAKEPCSNGVSMGSPCLKNSLIHLDSCGNFHVYSFLFILAPVCTSHHLPPPLCQQDLLWGTVGARLGAPDIVDSPAQELGESIGLGDGELDDENWGSMACVYRGQESLGLQTLNIPPHL